MAGPVISAGGTTRKETSAAGTAAGRPEAEKTKGDLGILVDAATRRAASSAAGAAEPDAKAKEAASQAALQDHFRRGIEAWTARTGPYATREEFRLRESLVAAATLKSWEASLAAAGYAVTRADGFFVVALSA